MSLFKCKICGGSLDVAVGATVAECEYCGTQQTLPKLNDEKRMNLYERANHFRRNNEFDKAMDIYEQILNEDGSDAEAYWSLVLCRYGIEYVEDPHSHKRMPTVNRAQFTSIFDDDNYKSALRYADMHQKVLYEEEAIAINEIQKGILAISQREEPFDVFICYKESDENGRRTPDSVLAQDLYYELTEEGFKVFFSRITLEDKLGSAYEPYIFAALNSAKVMVVLGTKPEYFNAVWVKNEWSRYLSLIKNGEKKMLIPAYRDMDPYHLPEEFSHLQAQDMSKLGFMQDLTRGIKKLVAAPTAVYGAASSEAPALSPIHTRIFIYLEDRDWEKADDYCDKALDENPHDALAFLGKLMIEKQCGKRYELGYCDTPFETDMNYQRILDSDNQTVIEEVMEYNAVIKARRERLSQSVRASVEPVPEQKEVAPPVSKNLAVIEKTYEDYVSEYPVVKERTQVAEVRKKTVQLLQDSKLGKKGFPNNVLILGILAIGSFFIGLWIPGLILGGVCAWMYTTQVHTKRAGMVNVIHQCDETISALSAAPNFYDYAPAMAEFKKEADAYIAEKESLVDTKALENWKKQQATIQEQRATEIRRQTQVLEELHQSRITDLVRKEFSIREKYRGEEQRLTKEKADKTAKYVTLNIFQVSERKAIKERLPEIDRRLAIIPNELNDALQRVENEKINANKNLQQEKDRVTRAVEAQYPIPPSPAQSFDEAILRIANAEVDKQQKIEQQKLKDKEHQKLMKMEIKKYMKP